MKRPLLIAMTGLAVALAGAPTAARATPGLRTILDCNFDTKTVGQLIGTGGAAVGEPIDRGEVPAVVRAAPFDTPALEMTEDWGFGARHVRFEFLNGAAVSTGTLNISFRLYFPERNQFTIYLREVAYSSVSFLDLRFDADGNISMSDLDSPANQPIGSYATGVAIPFALNFDLAAQSYSLSAGGTVLVPNGSLGALPQGIGALLFGLDHDSDATGTFFLDDLLVTATDVTEPVVPLTWGAVKALYRR